MVRFHLLVLVAMTTATIARAVEPTTETINAAVLRGDAAALAIVNFGKHWNGPEQSSLGTLSASHPVIVTWQLKELEPTFGIKPEQIDRSILDFNPPGDVRVFVQLTQANDVKPFLKRLTFDAEVRKIANHDVRVSEKTGYAATALDDRTVLVAPTAAVEQVLADPKPQASQAAASFLAAGQSSLAVIQVDAAKFPFTAAIPQGSPFAPLSAATSFRLSLEAEDGLTVRLRAEFADPAAAENAKATMQQIPQSLEPVLQLYEAQFLPFLDVQAKEYPRAGDAKPFVKEAIDGTRAALRTAAVAVTGSGVELSVHIDTEQPATIAAVLISFMPRAKKSPEEPKSP